MSPEGHWPLLAAADNIFTVNGEAAVRQETSRYAENWNLDSVAQSDSL